MPHGIVHYFDGLVDCFKLLLRILEESINDISCITHLKHLIRQKYRLVDAHESELQRAIFRIEVNVRVDIVDQLLLFVWDTLFTIRLYHLLGLHAFLIPWP